MHLCLKIIRLLLKEIYLWIIRKKYFIFVYFLPCVKEKKSVFPEKNYFSNLPSKTSAKFPRKHLCLWNIFVCLPPSHPLAPKVGVNSRNHQSEDNSDPPHVAKPSGETTCRRSFANYRSMSTMMLASANVETVDSRILFRNQSWIFNTIISGIF
jgi:hypothetical protein